MMDSLFTYPSDSLIHAVGWALIHSLWQGAAIAVLLLLILRAFPGARASSNARYVMACVSLAAVVAMVIAALPLSTQSLITPEQATDTLGLMERTLPWLVLAWLSGLAMVSLRLLSGWGLLRRMYCYGVSPISPELQTRVSALCQTMKVRPIVRVLESSRAITPMVVGWVRPIILLPTASITGLSSQQLQAVIAHELAHVLRYDYLVNLLQCVAETLLFYHPGVWWIGRVIRQERERCCDDRAVCITGDRVDYARALLHIAESAPPHRARLSLASQGGDLSQRVRRLLGIPSPPQHNRWTAGLWTAVAPLSVVIVLVGSAWAQQTAPDDSAQLIDDLLAGKTLKGPKIEVHDPYIIDIPYQKLIEGDPAYNVVIRPNDVVKIIGAGPYGFVYIQGELNRPGAYSLPGHNVLTLKQLIASAGGLKTDAPPLYARLVRRLGPGSEQTLYFSIADIFDGWAQDAFLAPNDLVVLSSEPGQEDEQAKERRLLREQVPGKKSELMILSEQLENATHELEDGDRLIQSLEDKIKAVETELAKIKKQLRPEDESVVMKIIPAPQDRWAGKPPRPKDLLVHPLPNTAQPKERVKVTANKYGDNAEQTVFERMLDAEGVLHLPGIEPVPFLGRPIDELEAEVLSMIKSHKSYKNTERVTIRLPDRWLFTPVYPPKHTDGGPSRMFHIPQADFRVKGALRLMQTYGDVPADTKIIRVIRQEPIQLKPTQP